MQILHIAILIQLAFFEYIAKMLGDDRALPAKQGGQLRLVESDRLTFQTDLDGPTCSLIDNNL